MVNSKPIVLLIGGHDPTGGAGIIADAQSVAMNDCYPVSLITCLTSQNTKEFIDLKITDPSFLFNQAKTLIKDIKIDAIKIGALGNDKIIEVILDIIKLSKTKEIILDPVLRSSSRGELLDKAGFKALKEELIPMVSLITPNIEEARLISEKNNYLEIGSSLSELGANFCLVKDNSDAKEIKNVLFKKDNLIREWKVRKIKGEFQGTGCSLSSAIASNVAKKNSIEESVEIAQEFVIKTLELSLTIGRGQKIPLRF